MGGGDAAAILEPPPAGDAPAARIAAPADNKGDAAGVASARSGFGGGGEGEGAMLAIPLKVTLPPARAATFGVWASIPCEAAAAVAATAVAAAAVAAASNAAGIGIRGAEIGVKLEKEDEDEEGDDNKEGEGEEDEAAEDKAAEDEEGCDKEGDRRPEGGCISGFLLPEEAEAGSFELLAEGERRPEDCGNSGFLLPEEASALRLFSWATTR